MPPATPEPEKKSLPSWMVLGGFGAGGLVLAALALWLLWGGTATVMSWLPSGVAKSLGEKAGETKVIQRTKDPEGAAWELKAYKTREPKAEPGVVAEDPGEDAALAAAGTKDEAAPSEPNPEEVERAEAALAPIRAAAAMADEALAAYAAKPADQGLRLAAEHSIETLKVTTVPKTTSALRQAALEQRSVLVQQKRKVMEATQVGARATHKLNGATSLREAAADDAEEVAALPGDALLHVFLDTGSGWSRVEALNGEAAGRNGYVKSRSLSKLPAR